MVAIYSVASIASGISFGLLTVATTLSASTASTTLVDSESSAQMVLGTPAAETTTTGGWRAELSQDWDVLGPFPIHAREQHFLSPAFPLNLSAPIDLAATWPSAYADGGAVGWRTARADVEGLLEVEFPDVRWESLRTTEGWAALQHHSVLRTTLTVFPPTPAPEALSRDRATPRLRVNVQQGSFFAVLPAEHERGSAWAPEWHAGNIYGMARAPASAVELPSLPAWDAPTAYEFVLSGDYEIRLFGDPRHQGREVPKLAVTLAVEVEDPAAAEVPVVRAESHDVSCDFVGGWAFGDALGVGVRSVDGWWTVVGLSVAAELSQNIELSLLRPTRIGPTQTRVVPIQIAQKRPVLAHTLEVTLQLRPESGKGTLSLLDVSIPIRHHETWTSSDVREEGLKASYFFATSMPTAFLVAPPEEPRPEVSNPPILALHGAGVDIFAMRMWIKALPRPKHSWVIVPTGRTEWGLDWHGPSAREAWSTVDALREILDGRHEWREWGLEAGTKVLLMGHSNGGQGAWYVAARNPDRLVGVVPAAGYIKSQAYVSWVQSRSAHYVDPALRAILDSSLTPDDNDLFLSNLVDTPILAVHGGDDDNVPVWHTREAAAVIRTWNPSANVTFREDPGMPHWYDGVFANDQVESFTASALSARQQTSLSQSFTLTVANPKDSGSLHGWSVHRVSVPGRLARLSVTNKEGGVGVRTTNVKAFSVPIGSLPSETRYAPIIVDGQTVELDEASWEQPGFVLGLSMEDGTWTPHAPSSLVTTAPTGRIANILSTPDSFTIVVPSRSPSAELSGALRIAHNLDVYHKLDAEIIDDDEALRRLRDGALGGGSIVLLSGGRPGRFATHLLATHSTPFEARDDTLVLRGRRLDAPSSTTLFLHPHPSNPHALALFVHGADVSGLERALRLFPIRTGVTVPDWIVVGAHADERGSGGVEGAGVWGNDWSWNEAMSML